MKIISGLPRQLAFRVFENWQNLAIQRSFVFVAFGLPDEYGLYFKVVEIRKTYDIKSNAYNRTSQSIFTPEKTV